MSKLKISVPHQLAPEEAQTRIKGLLRDLKESQKDIISNVKEDWQGNEGTFSFSAKGYDLSGTMVVSPSSVDIEADLPFVLSFFKGKIAQVIRDKAAEILA